MKAMRGILKWTIRREGRIGRVWRRHGTVGAESGSGKGTQWRSRVTRSEPGKGSTDSSEMRMCTV